MDTTATSVTTTTKEWEWAACGACSGIEGELSDRVASLVDDEVQELYNDRRVVLSEVFDECYPDPTPENQEEYCDLHVLWLDGFEDASFDDESGNPGVVHLVKDGDHYTLTARDADCKWGNKLRTTHLDPVLSDEDIRKQVSKFLREQDPCGDVRARNATENSK